MIAPAGPGTIGSALLAPVAGRQKRTGLLALGMVQTHVTVRLDTGPRGRYGGAWPSIPPRQTVKRKPQVLKHALYVISHVVM